MLKFHTACSVRADWMSEFEAHASLLVPFTDKAEDAQLELDRRVAAHCSGAACFEGVVASG